MKFAKAAILATLIIGPAIAVSSNPGKILSSAFKKADPPPAQWQSTGRIHKAGRVSSAVPLAKRSRNIFENAQSRPFQKPSTIAANPSLVSKKVRTAKPREKVATPDTHGKAFDPFGRNHQRNRKTGDVFATSNTNHSKDRVGEFKVGTQRNKSPGKDYITVTRSDCKVLKKNGC